MKDKFLLWVKLKEWLDKEKDKIYETNFLPIININEQKINTGMYKGINYAIMKMEALEKE